MSLQLVTYSQGGIHDPKHEKGSWSWFELSIRGENDMGSSKKLPGGQSLAWLSHANAYNDNTIQLVRYSLSFFMRYNSDLFTYSTGVESLQRKIVYSSI